MSAVAPPRSRAWLASLRARRVRVVLQQDPGECAASCVAMILGFHGRDTSLVECRAACGIGRDGASARAIADAARSFGLAARGFAARAEDLALLPLPAIVHWQRNHFVVLERNAAEFVDVVDPASGRRRLSRAEFDAGYSGIVLTFEPVAGLEHRRARPRFTWRTYVATLAATPGIKRAFAQIVAASLLLQLLGLGLPLFTKVVVDALIPNRLESVLAVLALGSAAWVAAQALSTYSRSVLLLQARARLDARVMLGFFEHLLALPFGYFQRRTTGDLLMRLSSNAVLRELLTSQTISLMLDGILVTLYLVVLVAAAPAFGGIVVLVGLVQAAIVAAATPRASRLAQIDLQAQSDSQSVLVEALNGVATLKASGAEERALALWSERFVRQLGTSLARAHFSTVVDTAQTSLRIASPLVLLFVGARAVLAGDMTLGTMLALNALAAAFLAPLSSLLSSAQSLQVVGAHLERIADVLEAEREQDPAAARPVVDPRGRFELEDVAFRYAPDAPDVLAGITFTIEPGTKVAIVGATGSGKSTLGKILLGLHAPTAGSIRFDGVPLAEWNVVELRRRFGVVLQESALFAGSIRDNIAFHDPSLPFERVVAAAGRACIDAEIEALPMRYETMLSEGGAGLSGGQKQRISIARALAREPAILLLDEATSHLDVATEARIDDNLTQARATRVVIAHRLSTVRNADRILVLERGRIVESGRHEELVARGGAYAALVRAQRGA